MTLKRESKKRVLKFIKNVTNCLTGTTWTCRLLIEEINTLMEFPSTDSKYLVLYLIDSEGNECVDVKWLNYICMCCIAKISRKCICSWTPAFFSFYKLFILLSRRLLVDAKIFFLWICQTNTTKEGCSFKAMATKLTNAMPCERSHSKSMANCNYKLRSIEGKSWFFIHMTSHEGG